MNPMESFVERAIERPLKKLVHTFGRFPAAGVIALADIAICYQAVFTHDAGLTWIAMLAASFTGMMLSVWCGLFTERFAANRAVSNCIQAVVLAAAVCMAYLFKSWIEYEIGFILPYLATFAMLTALAAFELGARRNNPLDVVPMLTFATITGTVAAMTVCAGLSLVVAAVDMLFSANVRSDTYIWIWLSSCTAVAPLFTIALGTRRDDFQYPKVWRVLIGCVVLPLFMLLMLVLLAYAGKCVLSTALPNGEINAIAIIASIQWMLLYFLSFGLENGLGRFFTRFGGIAMLPLLALQAVALWMRIAEYGFTPPRYYSCLFALFTAIFTVASLFGAAFAKRAAFIVLAALAFFSAHTPWNALAFSMRSQLARAEPLKARIAAGEALDADAKYTAMAIWDYTACYKKAALFYYGRASRAEPDKHDFQKEWGFEYLPRYLRNSAESSQGVNIHHNRGEKPVSTAGFADASWREFYARDGKLAIAGVDTPDLFEQIRKAVEEAGNDGDVRITLDDGRVAIVLRINMNLQADKLCYAFGSCLLCTPATPATAN